MSRELFLVDPATFFLIFLATICNVIGARKALEFKETYQRITSEEPTEINLRMAITLPITGSVTLILLFYFLGQIYYLMVGLICLLSFIGMSFLLEAIVDKYGGSKLGSVLCTKPCIDLSGVTWSAVISMTISSGVIVGWILTGFWLLNDVMAVSVAITSLTVIRCSRLKIIAILLILFFIYDVFWVFFSSYLFGENVMVSVATEKVLPNVFICPRVFQSDDDDDDENSDDNGDGGDDDDSDDGIAYALLGVGDVVLPGFLIGFTYLVDQLKGYRGLAGYFVPTMISYTCGLYVAVLIVVLMQTAQPALLYLVPFNLGTVVILGHRRGELAELWQGVGVDCAVEADQLPHEQEPLLA